MAHEQAHIPPVELVEELARRERQLEQLQSAYLELQNNQIPNNQGTDTIFKNVSQLPVFTGTNEITINSFISSSEYFLSTINRDDLKKEAIKAIFYRNIQGEAKNTVINIQQPDNWELIKKVLKLRYRPDTEPHHIYKRINNLRVNNVSELAIEIQNIKYKSDELINYYSGDHCIDLTNIDSLLVNTTKEMTQGTLLDKIYDERDLGNIMDIMTRRRFEDSCIRPEYRKNTTFRQNRTQNGPNHNQRTNYNSNFNQGYNQKNYLERNDFRRNYRVENDNTKNNNVNNSGRYRVQNNGDNNMLNNNFQKFAQVGNPRPNSGQYRWNQPRQDRIERMEVDNVEICHGHFDNRGNFQGSTRSGNPRPNFSQTSWNQPWQGRNGSIEQGREEINNNQLAGHSEPNLCQCNVGQLRQSQDQFFREPHRTVYPQ